MIRCAVVWPMPGQFVQFFKRGRVDIYQFFSGKRRRCAFSDHYKSLFLIRDKTGYIGNVQAFAIFQAGSQVEPFLSASATNPPAASTASSRGCLRSGHKPPGAPLLRPHARGSAQALAQGAVQRSRPRAHVLAQIPPASNKPTKIPMNIYKTVFICLP